MRFLLLLYGDEAAEAAMPAAEQQRIVEEHGAFSGALHGDDAHVFGAALAPSTTATTIRDGLVTDGPFAETREQMGGVYVVECADLDAAIAYARRVPASPGLSVEVRPLLDV